MTEREKHEYFGFDRFLQVVDTKYEKDLVELEKKYYNEEITSKEFDKLWDELVKKILSDENKK